MIAIRRYDLAEVSVFNRRFESENYSQRNYMLYSVRYAKKDFPSIAIRQYGWISQNDATGTEKSTPSIHSSFLRSFPELILFATAAFVFCSDVIFLW